MSGYAIHRNGSIRAHYRVMKHTSLPIMPARLCPHSCRCLMLSAKPCLPAACCRRLNLHGVLPQPALPPILTLRFCLMLVLRGD